MNVDDGWYKPGDELPSLTRVSEPSRESRATGPPPERPAGDSRTDMEATMLLQSGGQDALVSSAPALVVDESEPPAETAIANVGRNWGMLISASIHVLILSGLALLGWTAETSHDTWIISTAIDSAELLPEQSIEQLDSQIQPAATVNFVPGNAVASLSGILGSEMSRTAVSAISRVTAAESPSAVAINMPVAFSLDADLGDSQVAGDMSHPVSGYGAALDRLTLEVVRLLRDEKLLLVWLFDESESMRDDQAQVRSRVRRVYEELKLLGRSLKRSASPKRKREPLLSAVSSFGAAFHVELARPSADVDLISRAIAQIPVDTTGTENLCQSIAAAIRQYRRLAIRDKRKLILVIVTDEAGDDGHLVEEALQTAKASRASLYFFGRESVFGTTHAYVKWKHPKAPTQFVLPIRRGPETPYPELLQFDGFHRRRDADEQLHLSGFGPYEQMRLVRETGGIFFLLPTEFGQMERLDGQDTDKLLLREYFPDLDARREYDTRRRRSPFRKTIVDIITLLDASDPSKRGLLEIAKETDAYPLEPAKYGPRIVQQIERALALLKVLSVAGERLAAVRHLRATEPSLRWRANFDLMQAQLHAYRVRLFAYGIALEQFAKSIPHRQFREPKANAWSVQLGAEKLMPPDDEQQKRFRITADGLMESQWEAYRLLERVVELHPYTPWARRAEWELRRKFGFHFVEVIPKPEKPSGGSKSTKPRAGSFKRPNL